METILIMAQALAKASGLEILRLDIQFKSLKNEYIGYLHLTCDMHFKIKENGETLIDDIVREV